MLTNINYKGVYNDNMDLLKFPSGRPKQCIINCNEYKIVVFPSRSCRIMGCRKELNFSEIPFKIDIQCIQSITLSANINEKINLFKLSEFLGVTARYEPEIFPCLRLLQYNPICVNVFSSGKIIFLGIRSLDYNEFVTNVITFIKSCLFFINF
jgi:TATA-box binding protein (TBP) (component of TFIID and TFIIIB)